MTKRRGGAFQHAEKRMGMAHVCLFGTREPVPRYVGDTEGGWPHRIVVSENWERALSSINRQQAYKCQHYERIKYVVVRSLEHGNRLRRQLNAMLCADENKNMLSNTFREMKDKDIDVVWDLMLREALRNIQQRGETIEVFDDEERQRRIWDSACRGR